MMTMTVMAAVIGAGIAIIAVERCRYAGATYALFNRAGISVIRTNDICMLALSCIVAFVNSAGVTVIAAHIGSAGAIKNGKASEHRVAEIIGAGVAIITNYILMHTISRERVALVVGADIVIVTVNGRVVAGNAVDT